MARGKHYIEIMNATNTDPLLGLSPDRISGSATSAARARTGELRVLTPVADEDGAWYEWPLWWSGSEVVDSGGHPANPARPLGIILGDDLDESTVSALRALGWPVATSGANTVRCTGLDSCSCGAPGCASDAASAEPYVASLTSALAWALTANAGEYLVEYEDTGMTDSEDPGSRCGYSDMGLDEIRRVLGKRDLTLTADDRGLVAQAVRS